ncbi:IS66 family insertion sequence element accessory protein TnpB [Heyndrickxia sporothermodurans]|uniref:IS66 family insertion sequence element accessory protein TnpB n=1 Tax=Heyndrickxia sporothermodurans TaxID=46224 RepID=A0AB37H5P3_9BACI|nr:IS66 family insertion sequence element accessory protein TnpB [Heyndrickxia sporothermodurans]
MKILQWDHNGFGFIIAGWRGNFHWSSDNNSGPLKISPRQLRWLLDGLSLEQKQAHPVVTARTVI